MKKLEHECRTKITPADVKFEKSAIVREVIKLIAKFNGTKKCTLTQYTNVRAFVILEIFIDNGQRAGVLANITIKEFKNTETIDDNMRCITVFDHKKAEVGPIRVILSRKLYYWLKPYVQNFRKWVTNDNSKDAKVFLTWSGKSFEYSGDISAAGNSLWKKANMERRIGANKFRKAAVSATRDRLGAADRDNNDLANLMGHAKTTADRYYYMEEKMAAAERAGRLLPQTMRNTQLIKTTSTRIAAKQSANKLDSQKLPALCNPAKEKDRNMPSSHQDSSANPEMDLSSPVLCISAEDKDQNMPRQYQDSAANAGPHQDPSAVETLPEKIDGFLPVVEKFGGSHSDDLFSSSISSRPPRKFSIDDGVLVLKVFHSLIANRTSGVGEMKRIMEVDPNAKKLVNKYSVFTVQNRNKYEIRMQKNA